MKKIILAVFGLLGISCATSYNALETADKFDVNKYLGKWYEVWRLPNSFEEGLEEITANYILREDGKITVINEGRLIEDKSKIKQAKGVAWIPDINEPSKLKLTFFWPFSADYWVLYVDQDYQHALVGGPSRKYLWILSRDRQADPKVVEDMKEFAASLGFPVENMISGLAD